MAQSQATGIRVLPLRARAYVWLIAGLGVATLVVAAAGVGPVLATSELGLAASLLGLGILAQHFPLEVAPHHKIDMSLAAYFAALLLFPPAAAVVLAGLAQALGQASLALRRNPATGRRRRGLRGILFNTGQLVVATALGGLVYVGLGLPDLLTIPASALTLYLANYFAVQAMLWLEDGFNGPPALAELARQSPEFAALCVVGLVTAIAGRQTVLAPALMALPTAALYITQRQITEAMARERQVMARERETRVEAETAHREAAMIAEQYARTLAAVGDGILRTDTEGRIELANPAAAELIGSPLHELVGRRLDAVVRLTEGEQAVVDRIDGRQVPIEYTAARLADGDVVVIRDISLRLEAERNRELLARAEKLRAVGQMASGIAHDLNQSLALISGYAHMAREGLEDRLLGAEGPAAHLDVIASAAHDGAETVRRLLAWTRTSRPAEGTLVDLEQLLPEVAHLTAPRWRDAAQAEGHPVELRVEVSGPALIEGNSASLREALTNLVFNAVDAMPSGGSITLRARRRADEVLVEVADTGPGIPPEVRGRMFEPFFTTKGERGTGLGLPQVMAAVEQHHGRLDVDTPPEQGTTFRLVFPAANRTEPVAAAASAQPSSTTRRALRILAVDDEERLARLVAKMLNSQGHAVTTTTSGEQALVLLDREPIDLVITDLGLGTGMNGWELADTIREHHPGVRVILATGWGAGISPEEATAHGVQAVVAKPYSARDLRQLVAWIAESGVSA